ncbi:phosphate signaling complex protein PhoU [Methylovulum psychrotolerans]|uniref:Phosphate-specific transport system accessory protein PhoU n=1 Tax=Methylovulum psychrotolerans TaxID=1704499 RepID=A0A2S5CIH8_9GAMM|nr:phosphate signaling complex protein PhoU [Methylovulum psychrotolerans]POZ50618.1 phosphate transport system regulatory protein PhoU [Methylovulum psychrotolerans]
MDDSKIRRHISRQFNTELEEIRNKVLVMGGLVEQQLALAIQAFTTNDMETAEFVLRRDILINDMEVEIDLECTQTIALRQPTAFDLRVLLTVIKIIGELEIIGDHAERIAKMAIKLSDTEGKHEQYHEILHMAELVKKMLHGALDAFARMSIDGITAITGMDGKVDLEYAGIVRQWVTHMMEDPRNITRTLHGLWAVRALERIGDHACYLCEHLIFMVKGEAVRHLSQQELEAKLKS